MEPQSWLGSWNAFVDYVAEQYSRGEDDGVIADAIIGRSVRWSGRVVRLEINSEFVPGIEFDMGSHRVELRDGKHIDQSYLYLHVSDPASWVSTKVGDHVEFVGEINKSDERSPFSPIRLINDAEKKAVAIKLGVQNGVRTS
jgi:hypothetical protein